MVTSIDHQDNKLMSKLKNQNVEFLQNIHFLSNISIINEQLNTIQ